MIWPVAVLVIVTCAPLITAPEGSLTAPTMLPVPTVVWPSEGCVRNTAKTAESEATRIRTRFLLAVANVPKPGTQCNRSKRTWLLFIIRLPVACY